MQLSIIVALLSASAALAAPVEDAGPSIIPRAIGDVKVGFGNQLQNFDQANHWVVWVHGESACPNTRTLVHLTENPCNHEFELKGYKYYLGNCDGNNEPHNLYTPTGPVLLHNCQKNTKITCHGDTHDIIQHGFCE
jgi:hypothetical protein